MWLGQKHSLEPHSPTADRRVSGVGQEAELWSTSASPKVRCMHSLSMSRMQQMRRDVFFRTTYRTSFQINRTYGCSFPPINRATFLISHLACLIQPFGTPRLSPLPPARV